MDECKPLHNGKEGADCGADPNNAERTAVRFDDGTEVSVKRENYLIIGLGMFDAERS